MQGEREEEAQATRALHALVVEDDPLWREHATGLLTRAGLSVTAAQNASEAIQLARKYSYDIALIDYLLGSGESGIEVARSVRQTSPNSVVIILTGWPDLTVIRTQDVKIDDLVLKSDISLQTLQDRISDAARRRRLDEGALKLAYIDTVVNDNISAIAHEIRSPLVTIDHTAANLLSGVLGSLSHEQRGAVDLIAALARRGLNLANGHLELGRIASGAGPSREFKIDVVSLLRQELTARKGEALKKGVQFGLDTPFSSYVARIDANILRIGLNPLLDNAIKFSPADGIVSLRLEAADGYLKVAVADNGPGMLEGDLQNLMGIHNIAQSSSPSPRARGTGLGLTIARRAAELHGGRLEVQVNGDSVAIVLVLQEYRGRGRSEVR